MIKTISFTDGLEFSQSDNDLSKLSTASVRSGTDATLFNFASGNSFNLSKSVKKTSSIFDLEKNFLNLDNPGLKDFSKI